ncbi:hypothetical protein SUNI508_04636 [Seiridium unicorne]|uniref:Uncharacterized protein n=1 Tax=Seiridium unicorne TaxID=138068 RepID=A0ABR2V8T9_9PEZI
MSTSNTQPPMTVGVASVNLITRVLAYIDGEESIQTLMIGRNGIVNPFHEWVRQSGMGSGAFTKDVFHQIISWIVLNHSWRYNSTDLPTNGALLNRNGRAAEIVAYFTSDAFGSVIQGPTVSLIELNDITQIMIQQLSPVWDVAKFRNFHEFALRLFRVKRQVAVGLENRTVRCMSNLRLPVEALEFLLVKEGDFRDVYPIVYKWFSPLEVDISVPIDVSNLTWTDCYANIKLKIEWLKGSTDDAEQHLATKGAETVTFLDSIPSGSSGASEQSSERAE